MGQVSIRMPQLGESAAEAAIVAWLLVEGEAVATDQDLLEVETEKSVMTVTAPTAGVLARCLAKAGDRCQVGDILGEITVDGAGTAVESRSDEVFPDDDDDGERPRTGTTHFATDAESVAIQSSGNALEREVPPAKTAGSGYFSPRVRALMDEYGLSSTDLAAIRGSGRAGRVSTRDVEKYLNALESATTSMASPMRIAVADSMRRSWTRPLATIACEVCMDPILAHRRGLPGRPSATVYALRALGLALKQDDRPACRLVGDRLVHPPSIDLAFAVEVEDGVRTPVIRGVDQLDMIALTRAYDDAFPRSRDQLGNTDAPSIATVSNYGTFGVTWATPVPLPDQSLILGLGAIKNVPDWNPRTASWDRMRAAELTLTFDHRVIDGGAAGRLLRQVADLLAKPNRLT